MEATTIFARILVGFDGSPESRGALRLAEGLAGEGTTLLLAPGAEQLPRLASGVACDLIVLGDDRGHGGGRPVLGEPAAVTLRAAACAVAIAPAERSGPLRAVGVGFDGSSAGRHALAVAAQLAAERDARLIVLSVVDPRHAYATAGPDGGYGEVHGVARAALAAAVAELHGVRDLHRQLHEGDPVHEVVALGRDVDLLVLGARVDRPTRRIGLGGVGTGVVRRTRRPVLVVPDLDGGEPGPAVSRMA